MRDLNKKYIASICAVVRFAFPLFFFLSFSSFAFGAPIIKNTAKVTSSGIDYPSNETRIVVCTTAKIEFLKYAPSHPDAEMVKVRQTKHLNSSGNYVDMPPPLDINSPIPLIKVNAYPAGETFFVRVIDHGMNLDPLAMEAIVLTIEMDGNGDREILSLTESDADTGVFAGYIQSKNSSTEELDGILSVYKNSKTIAKYIYRCGDIDGDATEIMLDAAALVDPFGIVFDSSNGSPVDGAAVTLWDVTADKPADVYGDDGVSKYPSTVTTGGTVTDESGAVYAFPAGEYRFPFIAPGTYRLYVAPPSGYKWPSTVSNDDLRSLGNFAIEMGSKGEIFYVNPGPAIRIDIPVDPILTSLYVTKTASKTTVSIGDFIQYKVTVENTTGDSIDNIIVSDKLPLGFGYRKGSARIDGAKLNDPSISDDGRTLTFSIGTLAGGQKISISYVVEIAAGAKPGKAVNKASAIGNGGGAVSNIASASVMVREDLFGSKTIIMGRVFPNGCSSSQDIEGVAGVRIYLEDGTYAITDKNGMYHFEGLKPGTHVVQLDLITLPEGYELIVCEENSRFAGRPYSQFVDLQGGTMWLADFYALRKTNKEDPNAEKATDELKQDNKRKMPEFDADLLNRLLPGLEALWPYEGFYPSIPSVKAAVKHDPDKTIRLFMNGQEVEALYFEGTKKRKDNQLAVSLWIGIHLKDGGNLLEAVEYDKDGREINRIKRVIHYSGNPVNVRIAPEKSRLTADGKTPPVIAVRFTDKEGHPAREGTFGEYSVDPPYLPLEKIEDFQKNPLSVSKSERLKYAIGEDGAALINIQPTTKTGEIILRFDIAGVKREVRTWLVPGERDWILAGLAEGTVGYNTVRGNMESLDSSDLDDRYYEDGRLAFFAKGMIKGKWLLTIAYDSDKNRTKNKGSLHGIIDPDKYYMLYGDTSQQQYEAASASALYIKIERDRFYALFGDFDTGLAITELSKYTRNLSGFKSEMKGEKFDFNVFVSDTNQAFVKDEIRGDGTSGIYRLSRKNIVMNSESVTIEIRDRFRSEVIISSQKLTRHIDYNIDYDAGAIYFKSPVHSRDENFNPIHIVVEYESYDPTDTSYVYGGRAAARIFDNKLEIGATYIHEGRKGGEGGLTGIDAKLKLSEKTELRAEFAATDTDSSGIKQSGSAYLAELSYISEKLDGKIYVREQDESFGLGQQRGSESGTRKLGFEGNYRLDENIILSGQAFRQYNLMTDAVRDMAEARVRYNKKNYELHTGLRYARDAMGDGDVNMSVQVTAGGSVRLMNDRLVLRLDHDQSLANNNESSDFPTQTILGADYKLHETATLFVAQEFTHGENEDTQTTRIGLKASPWNGGQVSSSLEQQHNEHGARVFAVTGLKQTWQITKKWSLDAGVDRSDTIRHPGNTQFNINVPASSGETDFTAISLGAAYKEEKWAWTGRLEKRDAEYENKFGIFTGAYGEVRSGLGLALSVHVFKTEALSGADKTSGDLRFSIAYRPRETAWIVLNRLDYLYDKQSGGEFNSINWRIVNNMNINYKPNRKTQLSLQYGAKYVQDTIDDKDYSGFTDLIGIEGRYDITKKWDIGLRGKMLHSWNADRIEYGYGLSIGHNLVKNVWLSIGYNIAGFSDRDFSKADFTSKGPFVKFRMKFDQETAKDTVKWFSGQ